MLNTTRPSLRTLACPKSRFASAGDAQSVRRTCRYQTRTGSRASPNSGLSSQNALSVDRAMTRIQQMIVPNWDYGNSMLRSTSLTLDPRIQSPLMITTIDHGPIRELRMSRPPANALNPELIAALGEAVASAPKEG